MSFLRFPQCWCHTDIQSSSAVSNHISVFQLDIKKSIPLPFLPAFHFRDVPVYRHTPSYTIGIETFAQIRDLNP